MFVNLLDRIKQRNYLWKVSGNSWPTLLKRRTITPNYLRRMKKLEDFDLHNMYQIDRYLNGRMPADEQLVFQDRLEYDMELREDLEMAKEVLGFEPSPWWVSPRPKSSGFFSSNDQRFLRKARLGRDLMAYGIAILATAAIMAGTCLLIIMLIGGE